MGDLAGVRQGRRTARAIVAVSTCVYHIPMDGFEWDEDKWRQNLADHGVDFADAAVIFEGDVLEAKDERSRYGETRYRALGHVGHDYFLVVYTWRGGNRRIISAWKVGDDGRRRYQALLSRGT
jgi:uncharacterized DUF497 family protein